MKLPRDIDATTLKQMLLPLGYTVTRQTGSHLRLTTQNQGQHHITIPNHSPIKVGTLNSILRDIAEHLGLSRDELLDQIL
jgi:predicted RNA binding protein YcfA (HicA-like mRNA interferase family)